MMTTTVRAVLEHTLDPGGEPYGIYVVREGDIVLYVGRSQDSRRRLSEHFGLSWREAGSSLSSFYKEHLKEARDWYIDLYTLEECDVYVQEYFPHHLKWYQSHRGTALAYQEAETAAILHFCPCLNERNNPNPSPLPGKYVPGET